MYLDVQVAAAVIRVAIQGVAIAVWANVALRVVEPVLRNALVQ